MVTILLTDWSNGLGENRICQSPQPIKHLAAMLACRASAGKNEKQIVDNQERNVGKDTKKDIQKWEQQ